MFLALLGHFESQYLVALTGVGISQRHFMLLIARAHFEKSHLFLSLKAATIIDILFYQVNN